MSLWVLLDPRDTLHGEIAYVATTSALIENDPVAHRLGDATKVKVWEMIEFARTIIIGRVRGRYENGFRHDLTLGRS